MHEVVPALAGETELAEVREIGSRQRNFSSNLVVIALLSMTEKWWGLASERGVDSER